MMIFDFVCVENKMCENIKKKIYSVEKAIRDVDMYLLYIFVFFCSLFFAISFVLAALLTNPLLFKYSIWIMFRCEEISE